MTIEVSEVRRIAALAHLSLDDEQTERMRHVLGSILEYVSRLAELELAQVPETERPSEAHSSLRADEPCEPLSPGRAIANAPDADGPFFRVPRVLRG